MKVGIIGATGLVGEKLLELLNERNFPVTELRLFASEKHLGEKYLFRDQEYEIQSLSEDAVKDLELVFCAASNEIAEQWVPILQKTALVIDKSSVFRLKDDVPLVVPEVNLNRALEHKNLIASPNCTTIPVVMVLAPLHQEFTLKRVSVVTLQSVSGAGRDALDQFIYETEVLAYHGEIPKDSASVLSAPIAGNIIPQIGKFRSDGYTEEEQKLILETRKILELDDLPISATCIRVPVRVGHCAVLTAEFASPVEPADVVRVLKNAPGILVLNNNEYPMPIIVEGRNEVFVGRIRKDYSTKAGITCLVATDNLRKGAALNAIQIAEEILSKREQ
ncbi:MAG: aspartate-semialdehyde dehydrogenase [candidate division WOR-3 bacterium]|nr:aspartate-semialdehyde dehydrogenase [candidate division WOR-3 bacterium]MDW7987448.1 aspartate-semialdehyde dehydrogenase [candidate division WOR-3 bacterium]